MSLFFQNQRSRDLNEAMGSIAKTIKGVAKAAGLDFWDIVFEVLDSEELNEVAAYDGFPTRYPHWRFGMAYEELIKGYAYGLSKIYELVINNDPCYAYLMRENSMLDQKLVMAHVCGHADFFKNNMWFTHTNKKMMDEMANHGSRIRSLYDQYGQDKVEDFIDRCLSLENLIDIHSPYIERVEKQAAIDPDSRELNTMLFKHKLPASDYMDRYINPPDYMSAQRESLEKEIQEQIAFPKEPCRDILGFFLEHASLKAWQRTILSIIRKEAYYFAPQGMTKIMNEGWASYWHSYLMTSGLLTDAEIIDYADRHSGTVASSGNSLNPYKIGIELFRHIEERWNKGQFGKDWNDCDNIEKKQKWDLKTHKGREKIFQVRQIYNDITFIDEFLTQEFCAEHKLFVYDYRPGLDDYEIVSRDFKKIKSQLIQNLTNFGQPVIYVENANYQNRGELYLRHEHYGTDLKIVDATETLKNLHGIWGRPIHLETRIDDKLKLYSYDGKRLSKVLRS